MSLNWSDYVLRQHRLKPKPKPTSEGGESSSDIPWLESPSRFHAALELAESEPEVRALFTDRQDWADGEGEVDDLFTDRDFLNPKVEAEGMAEPNTKDGAQQINEAEESGDSGTIRAQGGHDTLDRLVWVGDGASLPNPESVDYVTMYKDEQCKDVWLSWLKSDDHIVLDSSDEENPREDGASPPNPESVDYVTMYKDEQCKDVWLSWLKSDDHIVLDSSDEENPREDGASPPNPESVDYVIHVDTHVDILTPRYQYSL